MPGSNYANIEGNWEIGEWCCKCFLQIELLARKYFRPSLLILFPVNIVTARYIVTAKVGGLYKSANWLSTNTLSHISPHKSEESIQGWIWLLCHLDGAKSQFKVDQWELCHLRLWSISLVVLLSLTARLVLSQYTWSLCYAALALKHKILNIWPS